MTENLLSYNATCRLSPLRMAIFNASLAVIETEERNKLIARSHTIYTEILIYREIIDSRQSLSECYGNMGFKIMFSTFSSRECLTIL